MSSPSPQDSSKEPELSNKLKITNPQRSSDSITLRHDSDASKLKVAAPSSDFRLSTFNLERIHRFVDEPQDRIGESMERVQQNVENKSLTIRALAGPFEEGTGGKDFVAGRSLEELELGGGNGKGKGKEVSEARGPLFVGCWLLVVGCWLLVEGCWLGRVRDVSCACFV